MKVLMILATDAAAHQDVVSPFRSAAFVEALRDEGVDAGVLSVTPDRDHPSLAGGSESDLVHAVHPGDLPAILAAEHPDVLMTFGREARLSAIWGIAAAAQLPLGHCVSCWRTGRVAPDVRSYSTVSDWRAKHSSRHVGGVIGTCRVAVGSLIAGGYFPRAASSIIISPPVDTLGAARPGEMALSPRSAGGPVIGIYDPHATAGVVAFVSQALVLTGRRNGMQVRLAVRSPPSISAGLAFGSVVEVEDFVAAIDVLVIPSYDDSLARVLIAALRAGKSVVVPDRSGAADLIDHGRYGLIFPAGSAYHLANAMNILTEAWKHPAVLNVDATPAIAKTNPRGVARTLRAVCKRLVFEYERRGQPLPESLHG
jgi:glycosyl transferase family 1